MVVAVYQPAANVVARRKPEFCYDGIDFMHICFPIFAV